MLSHAYSTYVLIVDDDEDIRLLMREVLEEEGFAVKEASDGIEAWQVLCSTDRPAVVIVDHNMPQLDGPGLMACMARDDSVSRRVAVIYSTAAMHGGTRHSIEPGLQHLLDLLTTSVLWKPFEVDDLIHAVSEATWVLSGRDEPDAAAHISYS